MRLGQRRKLREEGRRDGDNDNTLSQIQITGMVYILKMRICEVSTPELQSEATSTPEDLLNLYVHKIYFPLFPLEKAMETVQVMKDVTFYSAVKDKEFTSC